ILMWEISSGEKPFHESVHGKQLALHIYHGLRPTITEDTPQFYRDLMQKCWHSDPMQRPKAEEIKNLTCMWRFSPTQEIEDELVNAEELRKRHISTKKATKTPHPGAIYTSRIMPNITNGWHVMYIHSYIIEIKSHFFPSDLASLNGLAERIVDLRYKSSSNDQYRLA